MISWLFYGLPRDVFLLVILKSYFVIDFDYLLDRYIYKSEYSCIDNHSFYQSNLLSQPVSVVCILCPLAQVGMNVICIIIIYMYSIEIQSIIYYEL